MTDAPTLPSYPNGVRYPEGMSPFKAGALLFKVATQGVGSKKGKISPRGKSGAAKGKSGLSKSTVKTITSISKK